MRKMAADKERKDKQENIVIKGANVDKQEVVQWIQDLIKNSLNVDAKVVNVRKSGNVIIAKIGSLEQKNEIMKN